MCLLSSDTQKTNRYRAVKWITTITSLYILPRFHARIRKQGLELGTRARDVEREKWKLLTKRVRITSETLLMETEEQKWNWNLELELRIGIGI
jgi:hypothetical protein